LYLSLSAFGASGMLLLLALGRLTLVEPVTYDLLLVLFAVVVFFFVRSWSVNIQSGRFDLFELPVWLTLNVFLFMGVSGRLNVQELSLLNPSLEGNPYWITLALLYIIFGIVAMWVGYHFDPFQFPLRRSSDQPGSLGKMVFQAPVMGVVVIMYGLSLFARLWKLQAGLYGYLQAGSLLNSVPAGLQWLNYAEGLGIVGLLVIALEVYRRDHPSLALRIMLCGMIATEVFFTVVSGVKSPIVMLVILILAVAHYAGRSYPWKTIVVLVLVFILVFPVMQAYRSAISSGSFTERSSLADATEFLTELSGQVLLGQPVSDNLQVVRDTVIGRQASLIQNVALVIRLTPSALPYLYGRDYWSLPLLVLVPRFLWPSKPMSGLQGADFTYTYVGSNLATSTAVTSFGDLYMNFGLPGIVVGMMVIGMFYRTVYDRFWHSKSSFSVVLYLSLLSVITNYESGLVGFVQAVLQGLVFSYVALYIIYWRRS